MQEETKKENSVSVKVDVDSSGVDIAIEKVKRLIALLQEAASLIDLLSTGIH